MTKSNEIKIRTLKANILAIKGHLSIGKDNQGNAYSVDDKEAFRQQVRTMEEKLQRLTASRG